MARIAVFVAVGLVALFVCALFLSRHFNSGVAAELRAEPQGERATKVMLLTLPSGKELPVNYLREDGWVYAGADFPWWKELRGEGATVRMLIRGETLQGHGRAILDDPERRDTVFAKLRPSAPRWTGTFVAIELDDRAD